jgi:ParB family chromosome partitioning protein
VSGEGGVADDPPRRRLGRGLAALIGDIPQEVAPEREPPRGFRRVPVAAIRRNPANPRRHFGDEELQQLAASLRTHGLVQPILVREVAGGEAYEIVAGERRWRAAQLAGLHELPVVVRAVSDREALEIAIIENVQRADLNPIDEAAGYEKLASEHGHSHAEIAEAIGKSRSHVANTVRLLKLPERVKAHVAEGRLTAGHARALLTAADPEGLAQRIIAEGLTVRDAERLAAEPVAGSVRAAAKPAAPPKSTDTRALEKLVSDRIGLRVDIAHRPDGGGALTIAYSTLEQLDEICRRLGEP